MGRYGCASEWTERDAGLARAGAFIAHRNADISFAGHKARVRDEEW